MATIISGIKILYGTENFDTRILYYGMKGQKIPNKGLLLASLCSVQQSLKLLSIEVNIQCSYF